MVTASMVVAFAADDTEVLDPVSITMKEIDDYLASHPSFGALTEINETQVAHIPLSNGETATITIKNECVSPMTRGSVDWTDFKDGAYIVTVTEDIPLVAKFTHTVDYTLTREEATWSAKIVFTDTDISVIPKRGVAIGGQDAMITENAYLSAKAEGYFRAQYTAAGTELVSANIYSHINMSNAGGTDKGIVVRCNSYYTL